MKGWYLDTSAVFKLIFIEPESKTLLSYLKNRNVTSRLTRVEIARNIKGFEKQVQAKTSSILSTISLIELSPPIMISAEQAVASTALRPADSIHVASALNIGEAIEGLITYDKVMAQEARKLGLRVESPGSDVAKGN